MAAAGKKGEQMEADMMEPGSRGEEDIDRVEEREKMEEDRLKGGRAEVDREKRVTRGKPAEAYLAGRIDKQASQKQWGYLLVFY
jgi:hypothetical protein